MQHPTPGHPAGTPPPAAKAGDRTRKGRGPVLFQTFAAR